MVALVAFLTLIGMVVGLCWLAFVLFATCVAWKKWTEGESEINRRREDMRESD